MSAPRNKLAGRYELLEVAGEGGMAVVWRATMHGAAGFARPVAVKKVKAEHREATNYIAMFVEEARLGSDLAHPNIAQVLDFCVDEQGSYYLVMEWVEGLDLGTFVRSYVQTGRQVPWPLVVAIGVGALRGLAAAHERRHVDGTLAPIVHRDVSPHNILLGTNGLVKLTDFGLARARDRSYSLTAPGTVKGKLSYLCPEVARGEQATPRSDLFAMGCVLWEALAGRRLFDASSDLEVFRRIRACKIEPLDPLRAGLPRALVGAVERALAKEPAERFASAREMAGELAALLADAPRDVDAHTGLGRAVREARQRLGIGADWISVHGQLKEQSHLLDAGVAGLGVAEVSRSVDVEFSEHGDRPAPGLGRPGEPDGK